MSFKKIARVLPAYQPLWDVNKGAEQLYVSYRASGLTLEDFQGRFQRISHIKKLMGEGLLGDDLRFRNRVSVADAAAIPAVA